jgi:hypothetical protein
MCALVLKISGNTIRPGAGVRAGNARYPANVPPSAAVIRISPPTVLSKSALSSIPVIEPDIVWFWFVVASCWLDDGA